MDNLSKEKLKFIKSLQLKKFRTLNNLLLIEGFLPVSEAIRGGYELKDLLYTPYIKDKPGLDTI